jgi:hypothetical protein
MRVFGVLACEQFVQNQMRDFAARVLTALSADTPK